MSKGLKKQRLHTNTQKNRHDRHKHICTSTTTMIISAWNFCEWQRGGEGSGGAECREKRRKENGRGAAHAQSSTLDASKTPQQIQVCVANDFWWKKSHGDVHKTPVETWFSYKHSKPRMNNKVMQVDCVSKILHVRPMQVLKVRSPSGVPNFMHFRKMTKGEHHSACWKTTIGHEPFQGIASWRNHKKR